MIFGSRNSKGVNLIALAGHLSTMERHEASLINAAIAGKAGLDYIESVLNELGFKLGKKASRNQYEITRADDTKIRNAYLDGNNEGMRIVMKEPFSPAKDLEERPQRSMMDLVEQSKYGPGNLYDLFNEEE